MTRFSPTPLEVAIAMARQREAAERAALKLPPLPPRTGIQFRLLMCGDCNAVWPTERDARHGGSRLDGEPCAYRWASGRVCPGTVAPLHDQRPSWRYEDDPFPSYGTPPRPPPKPAYSGSWCAVLGLPWGTLDLALVRASFRRLVKERHPDVATGSHALMLALNNAYRQALSELGQP